jgi:hypothetical protein
MTHSRLWGYAGVLAVNGSGPSAQCMVDIFFVKTETNSSAELLPRLTAVVQSRLSL